MFNRGSITSSCRTFASKVSAEGDFGAAIIIPDPANPAASTIAASFLPAAFIDTPFIFSPPSIGRGTPTHGCSRPARRGRSKGSNVLASRHGAYHHEPTALGYLPSPCPMRFNDGTGGNQSIQPGSQLRNR